MSTVLLNNGSFYGTYGGYLFRYPILGALFPCFLVLFLSSSVSSGCVAPVGHFAQRGSAHRLQLIGGGKSTCFNHCNFSRLWPLLIDQELGI